jgi:hypothetical protein
VGGELVLFVVSVGDGSWGASPSARIELLIPSRGLLLVAFALKPSLQSYWFCRFWGSRLWEIFSSVVFVRQFIEPFVTPFVNRYSSTLSALLGLTFEEVNFMEK